MPGRHNIIHEIDYSDPARPCRCDNPLADPREMTCLYCGHQVGGVPIPSAGGRSFRHPGPTFARKTRRGTTPQ